MATWKELIKQNSNITPSIVLQNKKWNWYKLSLNKMNYDPYFCSDHYRKKQFWDVSKEEFIAMTWHPDRINCGWCLDEDDKKERLGFYGI